MGPERTDKEISIAEMDDFADDIVVSLNLSKLIRVLRQFEQMKRTSRKEDAERLFLSSTLRKEVFGDD